MPSEKKKKFETDRYAGQFGPGRRIWTKVGSMEAVGYIEEDEEGAGNQLIKLTLSGKARSMFIPLHYLREDELLAMKRVIDIMFEAARPECRTRDEAAEQALLDGDTSHPRYFRDPPIIWKREGEEFMDTIEVLPDGWTEDGLGKFYDRDVGSHKRSLRPVELDDTTYGVGENKEAN